MNDNEQKRQDYEGAKMQQTADCGKSSQDYLSGHAPRMTLQEQIEARLTRANQEARRANRLAELRCLLQKNPEVARILDLIEETKG